MYVHLIQAFVLQITYVRPHGCKSTNADTVSQLIVTETKGGMGRGEGEDVYMNTPELIWIA